MIDALLLDLGCLASQTVQANLMKLVSLTHYTALYGANRSLLDLLEHLRGEGVTPLVLCPDDGPLVKELKKRQIHYRIHPFRPEIFFSKPLSVFRGVGRCIRSRLALASIQKTVREFDPQLIHSNSSVIWTGARLAHTLNLPHLWHVREFGKEDFGFRFVLGRRNFAKWLERSAAAIAISKAVEREVLSAAGCPVEVIYNGVVQERQIRDSPRPPHDPFTFCLVGHISEAKGQYEAVEAFAEVHRIEPRTRLLLAGDGDSRFVGRLLSRVKALGLSQAVNPLGFLANPSTVYERSDVSLMCSRREAMGRVTIEAMAHGLPVIGLRAGATPELIEDGKNGWLYNDHGELVQRMIHVARSPALKSLLGKQAIETARSRFTTDQHAQRMLKLMLQIVRS